MHLRHKIVAVILTLIFTSFSTKAIAEMRSFSSENKIVCTYYFYWYDVYSKTHIVDPDGTDALTDHLIDMQDFSYKSVKWHKKQLKDMIDARIDVVLPVYWGDEREIYWSQGGLYSFVRAMKELIKEGYNPPKVGMFFDTTSARGIDLTTLNGKSLFYKMIKDFYSRIPSNFWAMIDYKPIIWLYTSSWLSRIDSLAFDYVKEHFQKDFGYIPYIVKEVSWGIIPADNIYAWGAALNGPNFYGIAAIGPGYNDSAVPGRSTPIKSRCGGEYYEESWREALRAGKNIVVIETWNELHEGTEICETKEYGRKYIDLTAKYVQLFKEGKVLPSLQEEYQNTKKVKIQLGDNDKSFGLYRVRGKEELNIPIKVGENKFYSYKESIWGTERGLTIPAEIESKECRKVTSKYLYFNVSDYFLKATASNVFFLSVEYYDLGEGSFRIDYDSYCPRALGYGTYKPTENVQLTNSKRWKTYTFKLEKARFANTQDGKSDFRIVSSLKNLYIGKLILSLVGF